MVLSDKKFNNVAILLMTILTPFDNVENTATDPHPLAVWLIVFLVFGNKFPNLNLVFFFVFSGKDWC